MAYREIRRRTPAYRWVNEDYSSIDSMPFVGWSNSSSDRYLVAMGFGAWGISNGTVAGMILADLAAGKDNRWSARSMQPA